ncbi:sensor histidine kinase [Diaminobutyricibacter tongyongensis]|uniref:histidine kinase n=1 Tax=Leifsonia tongyongensis TaxID=1268043 RepID=A0A6L9XZN2_9MICO|nr:sensor histidine kinase [Diaminobutyricibacter tongyongensis]NEN06458.1 sensor histidine kinase [Diaminobutyricibacter tongyongensis]
MPPSQPDERWSSHAGERPSWGGPPNWQGRRPPGARWFPVLVALIFQLPGVAIVLQEWPSTLLVIAMLAAFASSFLLLLARSQPGRVVVAIGVLCTPAIALGAGPPFAAVPLAFAVVSAVVRGARTWAWGTVAGLAVLGPLTAYLVTGTTLALIRPLITALVLTLLVGVGEAIRNRRERYRELSRQVAARRVSAAEAERVRIARELHDVLAHSLSQISVQAGVGLHLFDTQPDKAKEALAAIRTTSGQALEEVRGVLGFLRTEGEQAARSPEPDLARIPVLVTTYERAGLDVTFDNAITTTPAPAVQLALYRVVQESLTNVGRHAQATTVRIRLAEEGQDYVLTVTDDGRGVDTSADHEGGGLLGMRERAELLGGRFDAVNLPDGGFRVSARIPIRTLAQPAEGGTR